MAVFRLKMASQLGEKIAADAGYAQFPIDPIRIAESKGIIVQAKPADVKGISGALIFAGDDVTLIYSCEHNNEGFENFCVAHELGHYFIPGHPEEILKQGGTHLSRAGFNQNTSIELEADHFASGLLLPSRLTRSFLNRHQIGLDGIIELAGNAHCSLTAAAIRTAECCDFPLAIIVSQHEQVQYAFMSAPFKNLGQLTFLRKGTPLPDSATLLFNQKRDNVLQGGRDCATTNLADWFDGPRGICLDEEVIGLGGYGFTLTVLSSDAPPCNPEEEEDEEGDLERSWTPQFSYKR